MGAGSRAGSVILRVSQLVCGAVVLGILANFFYDVRDGSALMPNGRLIYAAVIAVITILAALACITPFAYSFWSFPLDFTLFAAWLVAFVLTETLTGVHTCRSIWFRRNWGFFWGGWYHVIPVGTIPPRASGCGAWRTVLAFSFIAMFLYLISGILGLLWVRRNRKPGVSRLGSEAGVGGPAMETAPQQPDSTNQPAPGTYI